MNDMSKLEPNKHYYYGACAPLEDKSFRHTSQQTFSVGVFEAIPKSKGKGFKRSAVKVRVSGMCANAEAVYAKAEEICDALNKVVYCGPKKVFVK